MKKILIISSNRLGDSILFSGLNKYYRDFFKDAHITLACGPIPASLFKYCKNINRVIIFKKKKNSIHWLILWFKCSFKLWDLIIDLRGSILSYLLLTKERLLFKGKGSNSHVVKRVSNLIGEKILEPDLDIEINQDISQNDLKSIRKLKKKHEIIVIAPTANWVGKIWPAERFLELMRRIENNRRFRNPYFIIIGSREERKNINELLVNANTLNLYDLVGKVTLVEILFIMRESDLFVGNDSGLMHMAALSKIPTVGLFGPSDPSKYHPWGKKTLVIKSPKSFQELMGFKGFDHKKIDSLMTDLTVNSVYKKIEEFRKKI